MNCGGSQAPVGSYFAGISPYGALDMAGNALEWVFDRYAKNYYLMSPRTNPSGPKSGDTRVVKAGDYVGGGLTDVRVSNRDMYNPTNRVPKIGFRCAYSP